MTMPGIPEVQSKISHQVIFSTNYFQAKQAREQEGKRHINNNRDGDNSTIFFRVFFYKLQQAREGLQFKKEERRVSP